MRWLQRFRHLWTVDDEQPQSFEAGEQRAKAGLEDRYSDKRKEELDASIDALNEDADEPLEEEPGNSPPAYDVGEVDSEHLLAEEDHESHYSIDVVEAEIEDADAHLLEAEHVEPT